MLARCVFPRFAFWVLLGLCTPVCCDCSLPEWVHVAFLLLYACGSVEERQTAAQGVEVPHFEGAGFAPPHDSFFCFFSLHPSLLPMGCPAGDWRRSFFAGNTHTHTLPATVAMPVRVLITLPPADGPAVTEAVLVQQVLEEFAAVRRAGSTEEMPCSVSSLRLQQSIARRYPLAYDRIVLEGRWSGKWHCFAEEAAGLRCFVYTPRDYAETRELCVHTAANELRCCLQAENPRMVRRTDDSIGARLQECLLHSEALHRCCDALLQAAQADAAKARWRAPPQATALRELARNASSAGFRSSVVERLRRGAAKEVAAQLAAGSTLARHVCVTRLRRNIAYCLKTWVPAGSGTQDTKDRFMEVLG
ncbi:hypothetical protein TraAM80_09010 [Trypanosoma rangeli]|uniref:Uncharacterized protein n=1 Tax=Trypanosoma rangeli TaxID=5698 RepID=A0A422MXT3_TRYRA|nr:uncharacterized protein TraAM80_09010 [Trypanosoma rangeli]RNE98023.1 hypothetical protein TraAM80_09010 [Trypanosoma rangeli]|eukprot:RNE98023.1 hypothetical protein TraAM80_09010 [Trypanosoma rangeli]